MNLKNRTIGNYINLVASVLFLISLILYVATSKSVKIAIIILLILAIVSGVVYFVVNKPFSDVANFLAVILATVALAKFAIASIATFADVMNGINMFGSSGGLTSIIAILVLMALGIICEIISCFCKRMKVTNKITVS